MLTEFKNWAAASLGPTFTYALGMWVETSATANTSYCVIQGTGGPAPDVEDRRPRFRVVLLGRRGTPGDSQTVYAAAQALVEAALGESAPCGAASVRAITEPVGPAFTTENRAWVQVDFEVLY